MAPRQLALPILSLPPILYMLADSSMPGYSKGAQGLSVLLRVAGIFTGTSISPSLQPRQRGDRCAFRAGRNLPDKEFRYLRTVIVTAAVYRGFGSPLARVPLTFRHRAGVSPYTSSYDLAETCVFSKQSPPPILCDLQKLRTRSPSPSEAPLIPKLRGHFAEFLSWSSLERLGLLAPPTCVGLRYGLPRSLA